MSTTNDTPASEQKLDDRLEEKYASKERVEPSEVGVDGGDHALDDVFGDEDHVEFEYDPKRTGKRVAQRYDTTEAFIRELISNAETAGLRRCRQALLDAGYDEATVLDMPLHEIKEVAAEETGYEPVVEVEHHWPGSDQPALIVRDNGIGISREEFHVLKKHGLSATARDGEFTDGFGQGIMSVFMGIGVHDSAKIETRSVLDDASYAVRMRITGFNKMTGGREHYGTTITLPAFTEKVIEDIDVASAVADYAQGLRVPVIFEEYDEGGNFVYQEDYTPTELEEDYDEAAPLVTHETDYFRAVASPEAASGDRDPKTLLASMPIERNDSKYGSTSNDKFESPWKFDIRINYEDGRICAGPNEGLIPVDDRSYETMSEDRKRRYVPESEITSDDVRMPEPVDDRDRLRDGNREFFRHVSEGISRKFAEKYAEVLASVDRFHDILDMESRDLSIFMRGYSHFGPRTSRSQADNIQETLEEEVGVTVPLDVCEKLSVMKRDVLVVPRDASDPSKKGGRYHDNRSEKKVWRVLSEAEPDGDVYLAKTVSNKKANLAWALHEDNVVIQLDKDTVFRNYYDALELFDWKKLKDLPSRNLTEKFPQLDQEFLDKWDTTSSSSSGSSGGNRGGSYDRKRAKQRRIKVRVGAGHNAKYEQMKAQDVYETLDSGDRIRISFSRKCSKLIVVDQNEHGVTRYNQLCGNGIAQAVVPSYVYEYLLEADNTYTPEELQREHFEYLIEPDRHNYTIGQRQIGELTEDDVLLAVDKKHADRFREEIDEVWDIVDDRLDTKYSHYSAGDMQSLTIATKDLFKDCWLALRRHDGELSSDARVLYAEKTDRYSQIDASKLGYENSELYLNVVLPPDEYDRSAPEWRRLFVDTSKYSSNSTRNLDDATLNAVQMIEELAECDDVEHPFPSQRGA